MLFYLNLRHYLRDLIFKSKESQEITKEMKESKKLGSY